MHKKTNRTIFSFKTKVDIVAKLKMDRFVLHGRNYSNDHLSNFEYISDATRHRPQTALCKCPQLTEFTLFESSIEFVIDDVKSIFACMTNLIKLTLSIHDTLDPQFCHGPTLESILNEYLPHLRQFHYTMTHPIAKQILIKNFVRWPMNVTYYGREDCRWIHIYSLPWPENKNDKRQLPIVRVGSKPSVSSDVKRSAYMERVIITKDDEFNLLNTEFGHACDMISYCSLNDIKLPCRISKLIFSSQTRKCLLSKKDNCSLNSFSYIFNKFNNSTFCSSFDC